MSRLVNMGMVLARTSQGLTVQPVLLMMKAHGCHMTDDAIIPRATLGPGSLLTSVSLWELPEPSSEHECRGSAAPADAGRAAWTVGHLPWDLLAQPWSSWSAGPVFSDVSSQAAFSGKTGPLNPLVDFLCHMWVWFFMAEGRGIVLECQ